MSESLENLVNLLTTLADPAKFKSQLAQLREAMDGAAAAKKAQQDLEVNRHEAAEEIRAAQQAHDNATAETDKRLAARLVEVEAREKRAAQLEAAAAEHEAKAKAIRADAEAKWRAFSA
jgi:hypothetical protein